MPPFAALSAATGGKRIVCTEVGWASRPWTYAYRAGTPRLDAEDCSVWDQCVSGVAQGLAYQALLQVRVGCCKVIAGLLHVANQTLLCPHSVAP
jgi:hypothetical protein